MPGSLFRREKKFLSSPRSVLRNRPSPLCQEIGKNTIGVVRVATRELRNEITANIERTRETNEPVPREKEERQDQDTRQKGALEWCGGRETEAERIERSGNADGSRGAGRGLRKSCGKETAADRFVKPPRRKKTRPDTASSRPPRRSGVAAPEREKGEQTERQAERREMRSTVARLLAARAGVRVLARVYT